MTLLIENLLIEKNKTYLPAQYKYKGVKYKDKHTRIRQYIYIDCTGESVGRLATVITTLLKGKLKPHYHPSVDCGDHVILTNADSIVINKNNKHYLIYHPGRPGRSLKIKSVSDCLPKLTIERAVKRMLSQTETKRLMRRLKIYSGQNYNQKAQKALPLDLALLSFQSTSPRY